MPDPTRSTPLLAKCPACGGEPHADGRACAPVAGPGRTLQFGAEQAAALAPEGAASGEAAPPQGPGLAPEQDPLVGARVGSFQIVRMVGRGGMGTVYLAEHPVIGSKVAVKFLHQSMAHEPEVVARFYDEARAVNLIGHENIVGVYDLALLPPDRFYYVMEYLEGETLAALERKGRVPVATGLEILAQLCDALAAAHEQGVVHRDLKPENVFLVARRGHPHFVKLVDFGIAKLRGGSTGRTQAGVLVGTPEYMAPEQCDDGTIDARTDVYALGVMAFELFTGRLPFTSRSTTQLLLAHMGKAPPRPSAIAPIDPGVEAAILKALEKEPARRFQDMAEFGDALRLLHQRLAIGDAARAPAPAPVAVSRAPAASASAPAPAPAAAEAPAPVPIRPPSPTPPLASEIEATVAAPGAAPRRLPLVELTRAGLFLRTEGAPPPLLARVKVTLAHRSLRAPLALAAEVVRHVGAAEAAAMHLAPGFALQAVELTPEVRAALAALADLVRAPTGPARARTAAEIDARLDALEARAGTDPYALLGVAPDVEFAAIRRAGAALRDELELLGAQPLAPSHPARAAALLGRLDAALATVGMAAPRLAHDARAGNWRGVRRALKAGVPEALVAARREALLAAEPARRAEAERQRARAQVAQKLGNGAAAAAAFEAALRADPLDVGAHEAFEAFAAGRTV